MNDEHYYQDDADRSFHVDVRQQWWFDGSAADDDDEDDCDDAAEDYYRYSYFEWHGQFSLKPFSNWVNIVWWQFSLKPLSTQVSIVWWQFSPNPPAPKSALFDGLEQQTKQQHQQQHEHESVVTTTTTKQQTKNSSNYMKLRHTYTQVHKEEMWSRIDERFIVMNLSQTVF